MIRGPISGPAGRPRCRCRWLPGPTAATGTRSRPSRRPVQGQPVPVVGSVGAGAAVEHPGELAAAGGVDQEGAGRTVRRGRGAPPAAASTVPRRRTACPPPAPRPRSAWGPSAAARRAGRPPGRRRAGPRATNVTGRDVGDRVPTTTTSSAPGQARRGPARAGSVPSTSTAALSVPPSRAPVPPASTTAREAHRWRPRRDPRSRIVGWTVTETLRVALVSTRPPRPGRQPGGAGRPDPDDADLVVFPEAFQRDFGEPGSDLAPYAEPIDGPFADGRRRGGRGARDHRRRPGMFETSPTTRDPAVEHAGACAARSTRRTARSTSTTPSATASPTGCAPASPRPAVVEVAGFRVGLMTCYDLRFPELGRLLVDAGAEVLVVPAAWVAGARKVEHWRTLARARAIENTATSSPSGSPARATAGTPWSSTRWATWWRRPAPRREVLTATLTRGPPRRGAPYQPRLAQSPVVAFLPVSPQPRAPSTTQPRPRPAASRSRGRRGRRLGRSVRGPCPSPLAGDGARWSGGSRGGGARPGARGGRHRRARSR